MKSVNREKIHKSHVLAFKIMTKDQEIIKASNTYMLICFIWWWGWKHRNILLEKNINFTHKIVKGVFVSSVRSYTIAGNSIHTDKLH